MPLDIQTATPRTLSDAATVLANPERYRDRPTLLHLARLFTMSAAGLTPAQRRNPGTAPRLAHNTAPIGGAA